MDVGKNIMQPEGYKALIPQEFPPREGLTFSREIEHKNEEAMRLLGKLDGSTKLLPDQDFFLFMHIRKDAASSSQIEGTRATMLDALEAEAELDTDLPEDVDDILHYINALNYGLERLNEFPLSLRLIRELHAELMREARGNANTRAGELRKSQNWSGGTGPQNAHFVPPPVEEMKRALSDLENFMHAENMISSLIKAGLIHAQFETIHPFLDGNGRTGRMLISLYIVKEQLLERPVLFLSPYFKRHQWVYYERLDAYHRGNAEEWMAFFLDGVKETATEAIETVEKIVQLRNRDTLRIQSLSRRASESATEVLPRLYKTPIVDVEKIQEWTGFTRAGAQTVINRFVELGILYDRDPQSTYDKTYMYKDYVDIFR